MILQKDILKVWCVNIKTSAYCSGKDAQRVQKFFLFPDNCILVSKRLYIILMQKSLACRISFR